MTSLAFVTIASISFPIATALLSHPLARIRRIGNSLAIGSTIGISGLTLFLIAWLIAGISNHGILEATIISFSTPAGTIDLGLHVDGLSLLPAVLSSFFTILALVYNIKYLSPRNLAYGTRVNGGFNRTYSIMLLFNGAMLGTLFSDNLLTIFIFWELISVCSYALISFWNEDQNCLRAAVKCFVMTHLGTISFLIAAVIIYNTTGELNITKVGDLLPAGASVVPAIIGLLVIAALPKTVLFPLHTWLPDGTVAPTSTTVLFHVCGFQSGIYIVTRFFVDVFSEQVLAAPKVAFPSFFGNMNVWSFMLVIIGAITILIGALNGIIENDYKRIVAFSTISQLGFIVLSIGIMTPFGVMAGLFHLISKVLSCGLLFLSAGGMLFRTGQHDITDIGNVPRDMPITNACSIIGILSLSSVPLLSDFASKYIVFNAMMDFEAPIFIIISFIGSILSMAIGLRLLHAVFMKKPPAVPGVLPAKDLPASMLAPMIIMAALIVMFGIVPAIPLNTLVIPATQNIFPDEISTNIMNISWFFEIPGGYWNPAFIAASLIGSIMVFTLILRVSLKKNKHATTVMTRDMEKTKPYLCGEDISLHEVPDGRHLFHALANVLRIDHLCKATNMDRLYTAFARNFSKFCNMLSQLDLKQKPIVIPVSAIGCAVLIILIAIWWG